MDNQSGVFARIKAKANRRKASLFLLLILGIALLIIALSLGSLATGLGGSVILAIALVLYVVSERIERKADHYLKIAQNFERGAEAEEEVEAILSGLSSDQYYVLHDIPCDYGNIDHIVISCEGAVFAIETKSSSGTVDVVGEKLLVNGLSPERDYIKQARTNAMWLKDSLGRILSQKPYVTAVILFPNAYVNVRRPVRDVIVSSRPYLLRVLRMLPRSTYQHENLWSSRTQIQELLCSGKSSPAV